MKEKIAEAFLKLAHEKDMDKISVKDIVTECRISRQSFYYHFQDILEVAEWSVRQKLNEAFQKSLHTEEPKEAILIYVQVVEENRSLIHKLAASERRGEMERASIPMLAAHMKELLAKKAGTSSLKVWEFEFLLDFYATAITEYMLLHIDEKLDEEKLSEYLFMILAGKLNLFQ